MQHEDVVENWAETTVRPFIAFLIPFEALQGRGLELLSFDWVIVASYSGNGGC